MRRAICVMFVLIFASFLGGCAATVTSTVKVTELFPGDPNARVVQIENHRDSWWSNDTTAVSQNIVTKTPIVERTVRPDGKEGKDGRQVLVHSDRVTNEYQYNISSVGGVSYGNPGALKHVGPAAVNGLGWGLPAALGGAFSQTKIDNHEKTNIGNGTTTSHTVSGGNQHTQQEQGGQTQGQLQGQEQGQKAEGGRGGTGGSSSSSSSSAGGSGYGGHVQGSGNSNSGSVAGAGVYGSGNSDNNIKTTANGGEANAGAIAGANAEANPDVDVTNYGSNPKGGHSSW
jgi:hypothetical protein